MAIQDSLRDEPIETPLGPLRLRIGLHTGTARPTGNDYAAATMDKAARVESQAPPGEVLLSPETKAMVAQLRNVAFEETAPANLKGLDRTPLFRVVRSPGGDAGGAAPRKPLSELQNPYRLRDTANYKTFKGRTAETEALLDSIDTCTHTAILDCSAWARPR